MSARSAALDALRAWTAPSTEQASLRAEFVSHLQRHDDALRRACAPGHLTAGAIVFAPELDAVLLNLHRKAGRWFHFGGHWEAGDDSLLATATREAIEESGLPGVRMDPTPVHLDRHEVAFCAPHRRTSHLDVRYAATAPEGAAASASRESLDVRWWPLTALPQLEAEMHELIALGRARLQSRGSAPSSLAPAE